MVSATANEEGFKETFSYSLSDKQTTHTDHAGVKTRYTYDEQGNTVRVEAAGRLNSFKYDERGLLTEKKDNASTIAYSYDERNNLLSKSYSDGSAETWQYNTLDQVTRYVDRDGIIMTFAYDQYGNNTAAHLGNVQILSASFTGAGRIASVTAADGIIHSYSYDARGNITVYTASQRGDSLTEYREYDSRNRLTKITTAQNQVTYEYSPHKMIIRNSVGLETVYTHNQRKDIVLVEERDTVTGEKRRYSYVYDKRHLPVAYTASGADGNVVFEARYEYDAAGKKTSEIFGEWKINYAYDVSGRIASRASTKAGSAKVFTETFAYAWTAQGETMTVSKPLGISTTYAFDPWGRLYSVTDPNGNAVRRQLSSQGRTLKEQTSFGGYNEFKYDSLGRLAAFGEENSALTRVAYNGAGKILSQTDREGNVTRYEFNVMGIAKETAPDYTCLYFYDSAGRLVKRILGESERRYEYVIEYAYSENGRAITVTEGGLYRSVLRVNPWGDVVSVTNGEGHTHHASYDALGRLCVSADGYGNRTLIAYNALGRIQRIDYPDGGKEEYDYDYAGNLISITDSAGVKWQGKYDEACRLIEVRERPGVRKSYSYDSAGNVIQIKNGGEVTASYNFADRGRDFSFVDGNGSRYNYSFDEFGRLIREQNRLGKTQSYEYTPEGRVLKTTNFAGSSVITALERASMTQTVTAVSNTGNSRVTTVLKTDMSGNIVEARSGIGNILYTYDTGGRLIKQVDSGANEATTYRYDKAGRRVFMQSGDREVSYVYGKNDELVFADDNKQRLAVAFEYDVMGREIKRAYGNGVTQATVYDKAGRIIAVSETNPTGILIRFEGYLYDSEGRRSHVIDKNGGVTFYEYDSQSRLSSAMYPFSAERRGAALNEAAEAGLYFSENAGGGENRALGAEENSRIAALLRAVRAEQVRAPSVTQHCIKESYTYDANGNRSAKITGFGVIRYAYDAEDRLVSAGDSAGGIRYTYDDAGNMIQKKSLYSTLDMRYNELDRLEYSKMTVKGSLNRADSTSARNSSGADTQYEIRYLYDALGRRAIIQDITQPALRTLYDGLTFDVIKEQEIFATGTFTGSLMPDSASPSNSAEAGRYRFIDDSGASDSRTRRIETENSSIANFNDSHAVLYANGRSVALSRNSTGVSTSRSYFGTDALGSVKSATGENGEAKSLYDYDAFGAPVVGDFSASARLGYAGKQRDTVTGFYNYGYRDYSPADGRFTTTDPVRDGLNWFAYTHNDPVNFVDWDGLAEIYGDDIYGRPIVLDNRSKAKTSITVYRNAADGFYNDTIVLNVGRQTIAVASVQSEANLSPESMAKNDGKTLEPGTYKGTFINYSGKYGEVINLTNDTIKSEEGFHIHPNVYTNDRTFKLAYYDKGNNPGPFWGQVSAGCQVMGYDDFTTFKEIMIGIGFKFNNKDTINVTITTDANPFENIAPTSASYPTDVKKDQYAAQKYGIGQGKNK
jgi:RHS repeat-associated protein